MSAPFSNEDFNAFWKSLTDEQKQRIRDKARWEHVTLAAAASWFRIFGFDEKERGRCKHERVNAGTHPEEGYLVVCKDCGKEL